MRSITLLAALGLCACTHLHDPGKNTLAASARDDFDALELAAVVDAERENRRLILGEEVELVRRSVALDADITLLNAVSSDEPIGVSLWEDIDNRLGRADPLFEYEFDPDTGRCEKVEAFEPIPCDDPCDCGFTGGSLALVAPGATPAEAQSALFGLPSLDEIREALEQLDDTATAFSVMSGVNAPACLPSFELPSFEEVLTTKQRNRLGDQLPAVKLLYQAYAEVCEEAGEDHDLRVSNYTGEPLRAMQCWIDSETALDARRRDAQQAKEALGEARQAVKNATPEEREGLVDAFEKVLADAKEQLDDVGDAFLVDELASEALGELDEVINLLGGGEEEGAEHSQYLWAVLAVIDSAWQISQKESYDPTMVELLVRRGRAEAELEYARSRIAREEARVELRRQQWLAVMQEIDYLQKARLRLCAVVDSSSYCPDLAVTIERDQPAARNCERVVTGVSCSTGGNCALEMSLTQATQASMSLRQAVYEAIAFYYNSIDVSRSDYAALKHTEFLVAAEAALDADEFAINVWTALIAEPVNMLAAHYESGITPAELADLIVRAVGLGAIASGVSK